MLGIFRGRAHVIEEVHAVVQMFHFQQLMSHAGPLLQISPEPSEILLGTGTPTSPAVILHLGTLTASCWVAHLEMCALWTQQRLHLTAAGHWHQLCPHVCKHTARELTLSVPFKVC